MLWDRVPDFQGRASFRQAFRELMVAFGPLADELIFSNRETIWLDTSQCWIDVLAILSSETKSTQRSKLVTHCSGELLEELDNVSGAFGLWLLSERTRYNEKLRKLLEAELRHVDGDNPDADERAEIARRLIDFDPTHEGASRILMHALAEKGERAQALREYARCREALKSTLDVEPSPATHALYEAIRSFTAREEKEPAAPPPVASKRKGAKQPPPVHRNRLRVGVLPLLATGAPQEDELAFSLSQEIAAALARFRWFDVIAPVALKRRDDAPYGSDEPARNELDYVVDGALSFSDGKYQISVRLLDLTRYATPVWSDRFTLGLDEFHKLEEVVTAPIAGRIDPVILFIEGQPKRRTKYGATGLLLLAIPKIYSMERGKFDEAGALITEALKIDPDDAMVLAWAAHWHMTGVAQGWTEKSSPALTIAEDLCLRAIQRDRENAEAFGIYAHICSWKRDFDNALHYFDRALRLNPNLSFVWALSAATHCYIGDPDGAIKRMDRYREIAPFDPYLSYYETLYAVAYVLKGNYKQAVAIGRRVTKVNPTFTNGYKTLIAALGHLGAIEEAKPYVATLMKLDPNFTVERFGEVYPFKHPSDRVTVQAGLRFAGIPEN